VSTTKLPSLAVLALCVSCFIPSTTSAEDKGFRTVLSTRDKSVVLVQFAGWLGCETEVQLGAIGKESLFRGDLKRLKKIMRAAKTILSANCTQMERIKIVGIVEGRRVFAGVMKKNDWRLKVIAKADQENGGAAGHDGQALFENLIRPDGDAAKKNEGQIVPFHPLGTGEELRNILEKRKLSADLPQLLDLTRNSMRARCQEIPRSAATNTNAEVLAIRLCNAYLLRMN